MVSDWSRGDAVPGLNRDEVHVWRVTTAFPENSLDEFASLLATEELQRAHRFRFAKDYARHVISRGVLRIMIAGYLGVSARELRFSYSEKGKPDLAPEFRRRDLHFNVAHSGEVVAYAFAEQRRVGIDVEKVRFDFPLDEIAERFFSGSERDALRKLPVSQRHSGFFRCWTRKEAYVKATGDGLSLPLGDFDVALSAEAPARLLATRPDPSEATKWRMEDLDFGEDYAAALVINSK